jgi:lipopolysaccharide transport system permease protein
MHNDTNSSFRRDIHAEYFGRRHVTVIEPVRGWRSLDLKELWAYHELLWALAMRDISIRYKQTILGFAWAVLQPVALMVVFSILFGRLANLPSDGAAYPIFVFAGLLPWQFFSSALGASSNSLVGSSHLISKVYFPRLIIPISSMGSALADFLAGLVVLLVLMAFYGVGLSPRLLMAPLLTLGVFLTALGAGTFLSALVVSYRDFRFVVPFMMQLWMFVTPVIYPLSMVPERWRWVFDLNPMSGLIEGFRSAVLNKPFDLPAIGFSMLIAVAFLAVAIAYFEKVERQFADVI